MKNKMVDVRNHLCAMLEALGDDTATPEQVAQTIERAKATAMVAGTYISAVKTEIDAIRLADEIGQLPVAVEAPQQMDRQTGRVLSFEHGRRA
ncbi:MAG: hypothetical protein J7507_11910 [Pseudoxanthomonas sp.]|nr:hypothetical protein [Pseudoxanthomonas sp.]